MHGAYGIRSFGLNLTVTGSRGRAGGMPARIGGVADGVVGWAGRGGRSGADGTDGTDGMDEGNCKQRSRGPGVGRT